MVFKKINSIEPVAEYIATQLSNALSSGKRVLWLVPGGSAIAISAMISQLLHGQDNKNLTITLTDERYGLVGHADSNWAQLLKAGFDIPGAKLLPALVNIDRQATTLTYGQILHDELQRADLTLGFFGIGADGHTAGILPGSPAVHEQNFSSTYIAGPLERITMTPKAILQLDEAVIYAVGEAKWPMLDMLDSESNGDPLPLMTLKQVPKLTIFNDYKGEQ